MTKRCFSLLLALCLLIGLMPIQAFAADTLTQVNAVDTVMDDGYTVWDVNGNPREFGYTVPDGGATVLIFFSAQCGNCSGLFYRLSACDWLDDPDVNIIAVESDRCNTADLRSFIDANASGTEQDIEYCYAESNDLMFRYFRLVSNSGSITWPVVFVATESGGEKTIRYADMAVTQPDRIRASLDQLNSGAEGLSKEEIRQLWNDIPGYYAIYEEAPSTSAPYTTGKLTDEFLENGLAAMNLIRRMAGLPDVRLSESLNENAQYGAVLLAANDDMSHYPPQPDDMPDDFYEEGAYAARTSNLGWGYSDLSSVVFGWMEDDSSYNNVSTVGHRRWVLNPKLLNVGFGYAGSFSVGKVFDKNGMAVDYDHIAWPKGNFPREMITSAMPWSITLNPNKYSTPSESSVCVTVTRQSDGKTVEIDPSNESAPDPYGYETYLTVNTDGYGVSNCIIFNPGSGIFESYDGVFTVDVTGIYDRNGSPAELHYQVDFFNIRDDQDVDDPEPEPPEHVHDYTVTVTPPTCTEVGFTEYTCAGCGHSYGGWTEALGHDWDDGTVLREPTATEEGLLVYRCNRCMLGREESIPRLPEEPDEPDVPDVPDYGVARISGSNRCETAFAVANMLKSELGVEKFNAIIIANGDDFADALAGSYLASTLKAPILLHRNSYIDENVDYVRQNLASGGTVYILGGTAAVPDSLVDGLLEIYMSFSIHRLAGSNRFVTNAQILDAAGYTGGEILVCNSHNFADALSASATGKPILLVNNNTGRLNVYQTSILESASDVRFTIIGGPAAVSDDLAQALSAYGSVSRVYGSNREGTSVEVAKRYFSNPDQILLAYSRNFPDGLCGGPLANVMGAPLILTNARVESVAAQYVSANGISRGIILGGTSAVSDATARIVFGLASDVMIPAL